MRAAVLERDDLTVDVHEHYELTLDVEFALGIRRSDADIATHSESCFRCVDFKGNVRTSRVIVNIYRNP